MDTVGPASPLRGDRLNCHTRPTPVGRGESPTDTRRYIMFRVLTILAAIAALAVSASPAAANDQ
jgi:hypothetical protein